MTTHTLLPEETMIKRAVEALVEALGPIEAARFLALPRHKMPEAVEWHRQWQATLDAETFYDEVFASEEGDRKTDAP
jgi:hypothetical protein